VGRVVLPDGGAAIEYLLMQGVAMDFVREQYRHCKPILVFGAAEALLKKLSIPSRFSTGKSDPAWCSARATLPDRQSRSSAWRLARTGTSAARRIPPEV
jgi:catalase